VHDRAYSYTHGNRLLLWPTKIVLSIFCFIYKYNVQYCQSNDTPIFEFFFIPLISNCTNGHNNNISRLLLFISHNTIKSVFLISSCYNYYIAKIRIFFLFLFRMNDLHGNKVFFFHQTVHNRICVFIKTVTTL